MSKAKRLEPIIRIADEREQAAARQLAESQRVFSDRQSRLDELQRYKAEYQTKFSATNGVSRSAFQFNDFLVFLRRLDGVIVEQQRLVAMSERDVANKRKLWLKRREKTQALQKAAERFLNEERALQDKKDQKISDERAQRVRSNNLSDDSEHTFE